jgi:hypothetical protein
MSRDLLIAIGIALSLHVAAAADVAIASDAGAAGDTQSERPRVANPLWAIPLTKLSDTRDRPVFSPSRKPPPAMVDDKPPPAPPPPRKREVERPALSLVGTVASDQEGFGIFLDQSTKQAFRLKLGENYQGWVLRVVRGKQVSMEKDQLVTVLTLPAPNAQANQIAAPVLLNADGLSPLVALRRK